MLSVDSFQEVLNEGTSRGNQLKFYKDGVWTKLDNYGCSEGLAEEFVSLFEGCIIDFPFVKYISEQIVYNDDIYNGCYSYSMFNNPDVEFVSCRYLFKHAKIPLNIFHKYSSVEDNIKNVVQQVYLLTDVNILGYLGRLLLLDALILNEDRHIMNIGVVRHTKTGAFGVAPCFDNGSSLFCTNWTYRKRKSLDENIKFAMSVARPFSKFYDKQVEAILNLGCKPLVINKQAYIYLMQSYNNHLYPDELNSRIKGVLHEKMTYYNGISYTFI